MIDVKYSETFLKDLNALKSTPYYKKIKSVCFDELPQCTNITYIRNLKKSVTILRVLNRKDIYKYFP